MKTVIYLLIAVFVFGIIAKSINSKINTNRTIIIESVDKSCSSEMLSQSAKIISGRLKSFGTEKFDITQIQAKHQLKVLFHTNLDINIIEQLLIQKGELEFYENYNETGLNDGAAPLLKLSDIESITANPDKAAKYYEIRIKFKEAAANKWAEATKRNIDKPIALLLDGKVIFAPVVKSQINNGICLVTGNFNLFEAKFITAVASNGVLPCDFKVVK